MQILLCDDLMDFLAGWWLFQGKRLKSKKSVNQKTPFVEKLLCLLFFMAFLSKECSLELLCLAGIWMQRALFYGTFLDFDIFHGKLLWLRERG